MKKITNNSGDVAKTDNCHSKTFNNDESPKYDTV